MIVHTACRYLYILFYFQNYKTGCFVDANLYRNRIWLSVINNGAFACLRIHNSTRTTKTTYTFLTVGKTYRIIFCNVSTFEI